MPSLISTLLRAARLPFLVLTPLCLALGVALLQLQGVAPNPQDLLLILLGALLMHVAVNGFNEYFDFRSGLDLMTRRTPFSGGSGALPAQPMTSLPIKFSLCAGILQYQPGMEPARLLTLADHELYRAKGMGCSKLAPVDTDRPQFWPGQALA